MEPLHLHLSASLHAARGADARPTRITSTIPAEFAGAHSAANMGRGPRQANVQMSTQFDKPSLTVPCLFVCVCVWLGAE